MDVSQSATESTVIIHTDVSALSSNMWACAVLSLPLRRSESPLVLCILLLYQAVCGITSNLSSLRWHEFDAQLLPASHQDFTPPQHNITDIFQLQSFYARKSCSVKVM